MPKVGKRHFEYNKAGKLAAKKAAMKAKKPMPLKKGK